MIGDDHSFFRKLPFIHMEVPMFDRAKMESLIAAFKNDPESVYNTWFINNDTRLKAFGAIRRGVEQVIADIKAGTFPTDFKGSSLEVVLAAITEQKQVFEGAAHAFYWKPKLRIPDIYENDGNKIAFGQFLEWSLEAKNENQILKAITGLANREIKGVGPAASNILYFLHPTIIPPFNTAIVNGFNLLFDEKMKLGCWASYLEMRDIILRTNETYRNLLSRDLGAITGLLFDLGAGKIITDANVRIAGEREEKKRKRFLQKRRRQVEEEAEEENLHSKMQHHLLTIGRALGYDVFVASNDHARSYGTEKLGFLSLRELPQMAIDEDVRATIRLIDVLWLEKESNRVVCAFEVEKSTSIYSGILRLTDLVLALPASIDVMLYLVAPDHREKEIITQLKRPSLTAHTDVKISYILFSDLSKHCDSICTLGEDHTIMQKVARRPD